MTIGGIGGLALLALAAFGPAPEPRLESAEAREAWQVFRAYIEARNANDPSAASSLTAPDLRATDAEGNPHPRDEERLRRTLAWEAAMHVSWKSRPIAWKSPWLEAEASEENALYRALGIGAVVQRHRIRVVNGQIVEWNGLGEHSTGRDASAAISEFKAWIESLPAEAREGAVDGGRLVITGDGARKQEILLRRWKREHPGA